MNKIIHLLKTIVDWLCEDVSGDYRIVSNPNTQKWIVVNHQNRIVYHAKSKLDAINWIKNK